MDSRGSRFESIDKNSPSANFLRSLRKAIKPYTASQIKCILVISAHWEESVFTVDYQEGKTKLIYDYYGFPTDTYAPHLTYPVPTDLNVANRVAALIREAGLPVEKQSRGFDHGTFIPLKVAFPEADIPVVQLSLKNNLSVAEHIRLGELLRPLRHEGVLIVGSGQMTHNLGAIGNSDRRASVFVQWVKEFLTTTSSDNYDAKKREYENIRNLAPHYAFNHPRDEHFTPLAVAFGAGFGESDAAVKPLYEEMTLGSMAVDHYIFYSAQAAASSSEL